MDWKKLLDKSLSILKIRPRVGGLEVSDSALRYAYFDGEDWRVEALRLPPGIIQGGVIKDRDNFIQALRAFHNQIAGPRRKGQKINVVVSLSSINIYSQVFSLPVIEGENLEKAVQLNIQMVSPGEAQDTYSGWELLGEDQKSVRLEILSSFINRPVVDNITQALRQAGFSVHSIESRALSLTRLVRQVGKGFDPKESYVALSLDSSGIEFIIIRGGQLYFQYFNSWQDLYGGEKQVSQDAFEAAVLRNFHQVINFYKSHWSEPLKGVFLSAISLREEITQVVQKNFMLPVFDLSIESNQQFDPDWYVVLGSGLRGAKSRRQDNEISLLGISSQEEFRRAQLLSFLSFWRVAFPAAMLFLVGVAEAASFYISNLSDELLKKSQEASSHELKELSELQARVSKFNLLVDSMSFAVSSYFPKTEVWQEISKIATKNQVVINRINMPSRGATISVSGKGVTTELVKSFTEELRTSNLLDSSSVNLPLTNIRTASDGVYFEMTLKASSTAPTI